jgi:hypothetical protein
MHRRPITGDRYFQVYKNVTCVGHNKLIESINDNRSTLCQACLKAFCGTYGCTCKTS